ncbi:MAG: 50S ribosomal protein L10 [Planctomycetota bacterium]|nr:MAG: 50S ribosomal protein L10 [Planctomycetota bacterium]
MPNIVNQAIAADYEAFLEGDVDTLVLQPVGMSVEEANAFRGKLDEAHLGMRVVKGSLARRALAARGHDDVGDFFEGAAALIYAKSDDVDGVAITASRVVEAWLKESGSELPGVKGGLMDGLTLDSAAAMKLAKLPTKADLQAKIVSQVLGPGRALAGQIKGPGGRIAGAVKSHIEKLEQDG